MAVLADGEWELAADTGDHERGQGQVTKDPMGRVIGRQISIHERDGFQCCLQDRAV
jgi:hypothetical protein